MLDAEARTLLDLMEKAIQEGGPKINALPYAEGRAAVNKMLKDSAADPPRVAAVEDGVFAAEPLPGLRELEDRVLVVELVRRVAIDAFVGQIAHERGTDDGIVRVGRGRVPGVDKHG